MKINPVNGWSENFSTYKNSSGDYSQTFSKVLDNIKHGKPADYDEETMNAQKTTTMTQVLSDGSTVITIFDEDGKVISQRKTASARADGNAEVIATKTENKFGLNELAKTENSFGLGELSSLNFINLQ